MSNYQGHTDRTGKDEWLTPPAIIEALGSFDLDPCSPINKPWQTAKKHYTVKDDGLKQHWQGRVWCNPPYGKAAAAFLEKLAAHGNGISLLFSRTETNMFFNHIWNKADAVFFFKGRLRFYHVSGVQGGTAGAPSVLIAYGKENVEAIKKSGLKGKLVMLK